MKNFLPTLLASALLAGCAALPTPSEPQSRPAAAKALSELALEAMQIHGAAVLWSLDHPGTRGEVVRKVALQELTPDYITNLFPGWSHGPEPEEYVYEGPLLESGCADARVREHPMVASCETAGSGVRLLFRMH